MDAPDVSLDHQGLEVLSPEECWELIRGMPVGRIAFVDAGEPVILPVNHAAVGHQIVFRTYRGAMLHEALMGRSVAFEVDGFDPATRSGWSVLARGVARVPEETGPLEALRLDAWADGTSRDDWVQVLVEEITGRRIVRQPAAGG